MYLAGCGQGPRFCEISKAPLRVELRGATSVRVDLVPRAPHTVDEDTPPFVLSSFLASAGFGWGLVYRVSKHIEHSHVLAGSLDFHSRPVVGRSPIISCLALHRSVSISAPPGTLAQPNPDCRTTPARYACHGVIVSEATVGSSFTAPLVPPPDPPARPAVPADSSPETPLR